MSAQIEADYSNTWKFNHCYGIAKVSSYVVKLLVHPEIHFYWKRMHFVLKSCVEIECHVQLEVLKLYFHIKIFHYVQMVR
jgi:hypothetical protein